MCERANTLARRASPFLYPCVIEYSLIAAAIVYKIYQVIFGGLLLGGMYPK